MRERRAERRRRRRRRRRSKQRRRQHASAQLARELRLQVSSVKCAPDCARAVPRPSKARGPMMMVVVVVVVVVWEWTELGHLFHCHSLGASSRVRSPSFGFESGQPGEERKIQLSTLARVWPTQLELGLGSFGQCKQGSSMTLNGANLSPAFQLPKGRLSVRPSVRPSVRLSGGISRADLWAIY